jgi:hypothetical protein
MLTFFSTPKPFLGHIDTIQRNAIRSWQRLHPDVEVILIGDDQGAAETCQELGLIHIKKVKRNPFGTKYLADIYDQAQEAARHDVLCHVNCDILLMSDFQSALESLAQTRQRFLMAGRRWDVELHEVVDFDRPTWEEELKQRAKETNCQRPAQWIDYFVFNKGLYYRKIPELLIGRPGWDNWLLWSAISSGVRLVDVSGVVCAVHQNHDYSYHPDGEKGVWEGEEALENYRQLDGQRKFRTLEDASHVLGPAGLRRNYRQWLVQPRRHAQRCLRPMWFRLLDISRPVRRRIGLWRRAGG